MPSYKQRMRLKKRRQKENERRIEQLLLGNHRHFIKESEKTMWNITFGASNPIPTNILKITTKKD